MCVRARVCVCHAVGVAPRITSSSTSNQHQAAQRMQHPAPRATASHLRRDAGQQLLPPPGAADEVDFLPSGGVHKGADHPPHTPEEQRRVQEVQAAEERRGKRRAEVSSSKMGGRSLRLAGQPLPSHAAWPAGPTSLQASATCPQRIPITNKCPPVEALGVVLLQQLKDGQQNFDVKVAGAQTCRRHAMEGEAGHRRDLGQAAGGRRACCAGMPRRRRRRPLPPAQAPPSTHLPNQTGSRSGRRGCAAGQLWRRRCPAQTRSAAWSAAGRAAPCRACSSGRGSRGRGSRARQGAAVLLRIFNTAKTMEHSPPTASQVPAPAPTWKL
jgi:hypothetical protein